MAIDDDLVNRICWKIPSVLALIGVGVDNSAVTHRLISDSGSFTVNLWPSNDTEIFVKFSKPATRDGNTLNDCATSAVRQASATPG